MVRERQTLSNKTIFDYRLEGSEGRGHVHMGGGPFETQEVESKCKDPEMRACMSCSKNIMEC